MSKNYFIPDQLLYKVVGAIVFRLSTNSYSYDNGVIFIGNVNIMPEIDISDNCNYKTEKNDDIVNKMTSYRICRVNTLLDKELNDLGINYVVYVTNTDFEIDIDIKELKNSTGYKSFKRLSKISSLNNSDD